MREWQVQEAKAKFSELLDVCLEEGPQIVSRRNEPMAVLVPLDEWEKLVARAKPDAKEWLFAASPRFDLEIPERGNLKRRSADTIE